MRHRTVLSFLLTIFFAGCLSTSDFGDSMKKKKVSATSYEIECKFDTKTLADLEKDRNIYFELDSFGATSFKCNGENVTLCNAGEEIRLPMHPDLYFVQDQLRRCGSAAVKLPEYSMSGNKLRGFKLIYECLITTNL